MPPLLLTKTSGMDRSMTDHNYLCYHEPDDDQECVGWYQDGRVTACRVCDELMYWVECPTGGWWRHVTHPEDDHDAEYEPCETKRVMKERQQLRRASSE